MPTVLRLAAYRFFFYASDRGEPPHVHVERESSVAKFWLNPLRLASSGDFSRPEIRRIEQIVAEHHEQFLEAWNDFFTD
jgi:Domain of unknown function (DUF4160)